MEFAVRIQLSQFCDKGMLMEIFQLYVVQISGCTYQEMQYRSKSNEKGQDDSRN
jgi:hypothetical protein